MHELHAHELGKMTIDEIGRMDEHRPVKVVFTDGAIITTVRACQFTWFLWEGWRQYPRTPLRIEHHIGNKMLTADATIKILSLFSRDIHEAYGPDHYDREELWRTFYQSSNDLYNFLVNNTARWYTTSDAEDYLEIFDEPAVANANATVRSTQASLDATYTAIEQAIMHSPALAKNPVAVASRARLLRVKQILQIVGPRGFVSEIDDTVYSRAILHGYLEGITRLEDSMKESRPAAKAYVYQTAPLKTSEYFNRKMQLIGGTVIDLIPGNCGSTKTVTHLIDKELLKAIDGRYYLADGTLKRISKRSTDLIGQVVEMRSPLLCGHRHKGAVCFTCMGDISYSIPAGSALGHISATELIAQGSQLILSVKHYDGSSVVGEIEISKHASFYITKDETPEHLKFNAKIKSLGAKLYLPLKGRGKDRNAIRGAEALLRISPTMDYDLLQIHRLTNFRSVGVLVQGPNGSQYEQIPVSLGPRLGALSREMIKYIVERGYSLIGDNELEVDLSDWDFDQPAFILPMRHISTLDYLQAIEHFIRSPSSTNKVRNGSAAKKLVDYTSINEAVRDLFYLVNEKLSVNLHHLEVIMLGLMCVDYDEDDYFGIPAIDEPWRFEQGDRLMNFRSIGGTMAWERQSKLLRHPANFLIRDRPRHLLDPIHSNN